MVAISIPIFTAQLEKAREATDAANIRSGYAEVVANSMSGLTGDSLKKTVVLKQQTAGWQNSFEFPANLKGNDVQVTAGKTVTITASETGATIDISLTA